MVTVQGIAVVVIVVVQIQGVFEQEAIGRLDRGIRTAGVDEFTLQDEVCTG